MVVVGNGRMLAYHGANLVCEYRGSLGAASPQDHAELLSTKPADHVACTDVRTEDVGHVQKHLVADERAVSVIHFMKALEIEHDECQGPAVPL